MRTDLRWLVVLAGNFLFLSVISQVNHHLPSVFGRGPVFLLVLGLPVAFAGLRLGLRHGLAATIATGLVAEAGLPVPAGLFLLTAAACVCATIAVRANFNRFDPASGLLTALVVNLVFFVVLTIALPPAGPLAGALRLSVDLIVSQAVLALLCGWFFAWQIALLRIFGFDPQTELREAP